MTALFKKTLLLLLSLNDNIIINPQISRLVIRKLSLVFSPEGLRAVFVRIRQNNEVGGGML
jgi:hypothetical protein